FIVFYLHCLLYFLAVPSLYFFFFDITSPNVIYTLSLHDALPISSEMTVVHNNRFTTHYQDYSEKLNQTFKKGKLIPAFESLIQRSEEHTSELQSRFDIVCRLLLEKKKILKRIDDKTLNAFHMIGG